MDLQREFHMTGGVGKTSYARNSSFQKKAYDRAKDIIVKTLQQLYKETRPKSLGIADLGCSSGPNTLSTIRDIIKAVIVAHHPFPGSFYGRLFPENTIHFIYASFSLHWLSKFFSKKKKKTILNSLVIYLKNIYGLLNLNTNLVQFKEDFSMFLRSRSKEVVAAGRMVLIILGREGPEHVGRGNSFLWELLAEAIADLVSQGEIEEEKLDSYELHFYAPSAAEIEGEVNKEGSFELEKLDMLEVDMEWGNEDGISYGKAVAKTIRAVQESMLASHFGEEILDKLFDTYGRIIDEEVAKEDIKHITFFVVLRRKL
ncbi:BnaC03g76610D [Brassica napus]|uniref:BnaC03g76610D protein n=1 Tax=Brassica napus TaxID=3708 RepID=A0A078ITF9_BRANA|nr:BnaC03g76610D [Brassica napus]